jgi:hypothetical protein
MEDEEKKLLEKKEKKMKRDAVNTPPIKFNQANHVSIALKEIILYVY